MPDRSRRRVLQTCAAVTLGSLAGCAFGSEDPLDIEARNEDTESHRITVTVTGDFSPIARAEMLIRTKPRRFPI